MDTTTTEKLFTVSDEAAVKINHIRVEENHPDTFGVRVAVEGGGCSGLSYKLEFENEPKPGDQIIEDKGVRIFVDMRSVLYLVGTQLNFTDGLNGKGFHFENPNASRTCACGESFAV